MKAFTIATPEYAELARITSACFEWSTGLVPTIVVPDGDPYEAKLQLPDEEQYLFFDADLLFRRKLRLPEVPSGSVITAFAAAPLELLDRGLSEIRKVCKLPTRLVSTGLFMASSDHRPVMARALELMRNPPATSRAHEETWVNVALAELGTEVHLLPQPMNQQRITNVFAPTLHFCMERGPDAKLAAVRYNLEHHAPDDLRVFLRERGIGDFARPDSHPSGRAFRPGRRAQA